MTLITFCLSLIFVLIPFLLSKTLKLGLEKDVFIATVRATIQLFIVGYILEFVFGSANPLFIIFMVTFE